LIHTDVMLTASRGKRNVMRWRPSVRPSVCSDFFL